MLRMKSLRPNHSSIVQFLFFMVLDKHNHTGQHYRKQYMSGGMVWEEKGEQKLSFYRFSIIRLLIFITVRLTGM